MSDCAFLLELLADGGEHTLTDILRASIDQRGHGLTVHSRVADLRKQGYEIEHVTIRGAQRGAGHAYRLVLARPESETVSALLTPEPGFATDSGYASDQLFEVPQRGAYRDAA